MFCKSIWNLRWKEQNSLKNNFYEWKQEEIENLYKSLSASGIESGIENIPSKKQTKLKSEGVQYWTTKNI